MNFSAALKVRVVDMPLLCYANLRTVQDFHDIFGIGVQKTIVAADGRGNAYVKIHCKKLPRERDLDKEPYLKDHWIPLGATRWQ